MARAPVMAAQQATAKMPQDWISVAQGAVMSVTPRGNQARRQTAKGGHGDPLQFRACCPGTGSCTMRDTLSDLRPPGHSRLIQVNGSYIHICA